LSINICCRICRFSNRLMQGRFLPTTTMSA